MRPSPHLENGVHFWPPQYKKDKELWVRVHRRPRRMMRRLEHLPCGERLWEPSLFNLEMTEKDLINAYKNLKGRCQQQDD